MPDRKTLFELFRFYQAALVNTAFGYGLYALLLWLGLGRYPAQAVAHVSGTIFNYATYSRHVFRGQSGSPWRFVAVYAANYGVNLALLALLSLWVRSPYAAGLLATLAASLINYAALKLLVFGRAAQPA
ncbi:GtrA family protein [Sphingomonas immobilis]|uniref:GtrA family protein n=1 Tax=Sphingomonas immobilis TaxID=3063997 RepID=A0ABT9A454_9SPHN|nr:GtrA family protein [Sphingomonas sp. CA1-15]MDO7843995.1 GtrA family protein [Sphingomonas sp. CA1-15]